MHILLTNDDGIFAPGLAVLYKKLSSIGRVTVAAPSQAKSGASHSISLEPLICDKVDITGKFIGYSVEGSPADCVKLTVMKLIDPETEPIDLVVSGINCGANVGINVYYSGTVAGAMEAAFYGIPAIALSAALEEEVDFEGACEYGIEVIKKLLPLSPGNVININIPMLSKDKPKGVKIVAQSTSGFNESYTTSQNRSGQTVYKLSDYYEHRDKKDAKTDTNYLMAGFITVTALHFNMTDEERNRQLEKVNFSLND